MPPMWRGTRSPVVDQHTYLLNLDLAFVCGVVVTVALPEPTALLGSRGGHDRTLVVQLAPCRTRQLVPRAVALPCDDGYLA